MQIQHPLFGAIDPNDQYHSRAQLELERIERENLTVFIPFPVYVETYSLLLYHLGFSYAYNFTQSCIDSVHLINPTEEEYLAAANKVSRYPDQKNYPCRCDHRRFIRKNEFASLVI